MFSLNILSNHVSEAKSVLYGRTLLAKECIDVFSQEKIGVNPKIVYVGIGIVSFIGFKNTIGVPLRHKFFAWFNNLFNQHKDEKYEHYKKLLFADLHKMESKVPGFKEKNSLKILEIGVGSGANFGHYPDGCHLTVVDPNPYFQQYYDINRKKFPNITSENIIQSTGEEMTMVPDASVDAVVITLVLCSVQDVKKVVEHAYRVLVPGGKFFFMEHVKEWDENNSFRKWLQLIYTKTGMWPFLFDGCYLDRNPVPVLQNQGFSNLDLHHFHAPMPLKFFQVVSPHLRGIATK